MLSTEAKKRAVYCIKPDLGTEVEVHKRGEKTSSSSLSL